MCRPGRPYPNPQEMAVDDCSALLAEEERAAGKMPDVVP